ncbi:MAG: beta-propeller fold lactonase family protein [Armatimonadota bacterium]
MISNVVVQRQSHSGRLRGWLACGALLLTVTGSAVVASQQPPPPAIPAAAPAVQGNRAPYDLVFSPDGSRVYVTESAEGTVAVIDARERRVLSRFPTGGEMPRGLALTPDGSEVVVANSYSGTVSVLGAAEGKPRLTARIPGMPYGVAVSPDGKHAYVTVSQLDELAVLDLSSGEIVRRIPVGRRPRAVAITPDGKTVVVANLAGGSLSVVDVTSEAEPAQVKLKGINVRGVAVTADGKEAYATLMPAFNTKVTTDPKEIWHNVIQAVELRGAASEVGEDQWTDFARIPGSVEVIGSPDQHDIVLDKAAQHAWVSVAGRDMVTRFTIHDRRRISIWPFSQVETLVGANPRGLALSPDGKEVWVANHLGNSLSIVDAIGSQVLAAVPLGAASRVDPTIQGQYLFHNARLTRSHRFTCASCHPDGGTDGLTWRFAHVQDGLDRRSSRDLRTGIGGTAPFRWSGADAHLEQFVEEEVTGLLYGPRPTPEETAALIAAVDAFRLPPNPHREESGDLTGEARQGKALFEGKAGCSGCHAGPKAGGSGLNAWIGTTPEGKTLDVPQLVGVYDSAPYLHDGRAATLEEIFARWNAAGKHGKAQELTPEELKAVLRYVREL